MLQIAYASQVQTSFVHGVHRMHKYEFEKMRRRALSENEYEYVNCVIKNISNFREIKALLKSYPKINILLTPQYDCTNPLCEKAHMKKKMHVLRPPEADLEGS